MQQCRGTQWEPSELVSFSKTNTAGELKEDCFTCMQVLLIGTSNQSHTYSQFTTLPKDDSGERISGICKWMLLLLQGKIKNKPVCGLDFKRGGNTHCCFFTEYLFSLWLRAFHMVMAGSWTQSSESNTHCVLNCTGTQEKYRDCCKTNEYSILSPMASYNNCCH